MRSMQGLWSTRQVNETTPEGQAHNDSIPRSDTEKAQQGMPAYRFLDLAELEATGKPLNLSDEESKAYEQAKKEFQAQLKPTIDAVTRPLSEKLKAAVARVDLGSLSTLMVSVNEKQRVLNALAESPVELFPGQQPAKETQQPGGEPDDVKVWQEAMVDLTQEQTNSINGLVTQMQNSSLSQRAFNMAMLFLAVVSLLVAAAALIITAQQS